MWVKFSTLTIPTNFYPQATAEARRDKEVGHGQADRQANSELPPPRRQGAARGRRRPLSGRQADLQTLVAPIPVQKRRRRLVREDLDLGALPGRFAGGGAAGERPAEGAGGPGHRHRAGPQGREGCQNRGPRRTGTGGRQHLSGRRPGMDGHSKEPLAAQSCDRHAQRAR